ncbi:hypothetical protein BDZ94DRAFT_1273494 [Collybia nuda]|uniref:CBM1 domain-containing protein n=1 Tax=Collybia nuda TaxID=64659 RepID=A0A9P5XV06_9AGAR|nr:hypothetical protein BDZ94DRAFT_1273494 [Collybia nuda]
MKQPTWCTCSRLLVWATVTSCLCSLAVASVITTPPTRATDSTLHWPETTCYSTASGDWGGVPAHSQCGGKAYRGPRLCSAGSVCQEVNEHYWVCRPYKEVPCTG